MDGNMSLAVATERYTPLRSALPGIRGAAEHLGLEVVLTGNTREHSLDQYSFSGGYSRVSRGL
jgi:hypothetical protein